MTIEVHSGTYESAAGQPPPVQLLPGPVQTDVTNPINAATAGFGKATNADLEPTNDDITADDADRRKHAADAARKFPENEADAAQQMQGVGGQGMAQMIPQMASSIGGAISGALGGIMGPLTQLPQQAMQAGQGAMQPLMSALQQSHGADGMEAADEARLVNSSGDEAGAGGGAGGGGLGAGGGGGGGTTPTGYLGPPPVPTSSPPTTPAGAATKAASVTPAGGAAPGSAPAGMTGMPMMPPGAMGAGEGGSKDKPAEKRVTAPAVPNGQPVKGRLTVPPGTPVTNSPDGKPVVTRSTRRILLPDHTDGGE